MSALIYICAYDILREFLLKRENIKNNLFFPLTDQKREEFSLISGNLVIFLVAN